MWKCTQLKEVDMNLQRFGQRKIRKESKNKDASIGSRTRVHRLGSDDDNRYTIDAARSPKPVSKFSNIWHIGMVTQSFHTVLIFETHCKNFAANPNNDFFAS